MEDIKKVINKLVKKGKEKGFVVLSDITKIYEQDSDEFDVVEKKLLSEDIEVTNDEDVVSLDISAAPLVENVSEDDESGLILAGLEEIELEVEKGELEITNITVIDNLRVDDPVKMYLKEIGQVNLLSAPEEIKYATLVQNGVKAREELAELNETGEFNQELEMELQGKIDQGEWGKNMLVESNLRLVVSVAKRYVGRGMQFLDLIQEGNMGLIKAVYKFDIDKGFKFSTYATWWIRQAITRSIADQARTIRVPVHMVETINKFVRIQRQLVQQLHREPKPEEIAEVMGITVEKVQSIQKVAQEPISLESPVGEEEDSTLGDFIADGDNLNPFEFISKEMLKRELDEVLSQLTDREEKVLRMRFGLFDGKSRTLEEVGREFQVTRERIRQIEAKALRKLRHPSRKKRLEDFNTELGK